LRKERKLGGIRPLAAGRYILNNKSRSASMMLAVAVSVLMIMVFQVVFYSVKESGRLAFLGSLSHMTVVYPGEQGGISDNVLKEISDSRHITKAVPMLTVTTDYFHFFGNLNIPVYLIEADNLEYVLSGLNLSLKEGRLPYAGKNEIVLDQRTAKNKGKKLGDYMGREVDQDERMPGKYKIVGILEGDSLLGLGTVGEEMVLSDRNGLLLFADDLEKVNAIFVDVPPEDARAMTKELGDSHFVSDGRTMNTVSTVIAGIIIFIMSFAAGNLSYAQYFARRYEFGTLQAIGYGRMQILLRAVREVIIINAAGLFLGILLTLLAAVLLNVTVFQPSGYPFVMMEFGGILKAIVVPASTAAFSMLPAWWLMSKVDPLTVVEKFE
jgi:ABC-type lipoprotein release transport system permease subunit